MLVARATVIVVFAVALFLIFGILAAGPPLAYAAGPELGALVNFVAIMLILVFGCYRVEYYNHATLVLSYLLLYGNPPADEHGAWLRIIGLALGGLWVASLMYLRHRDHRGGSFLNVIREFDPTSSAGVWKIQLAVTISVAMLIGHQFGMERVMCIRLADNAFGVVFALVAVALFDWAIAATAKLVRRSRGRNSGDTGDNPAELH